MFLRHSKPVIWFPTLIWGLFQLSLLQLFLLFISFSSLYLHFVYILSLTDLSSSTLRIFCFEVYSHLCYFSLSVFKVSFGLSSAQSFSIVSSPLYTARVLHFCYVLFSLWEFCIFLHLSSADYLSLYAVYFIHWRS